jgi:3-hydroxyacyl-CoA dehydrogenase/enoyl-CoA hydratase/3-hydroxybutyryl-CoA epimerase
MSATSRGVTLSIDADRVAILTFDQPESKVNLMNVQFIEEFEEAIAALPHDLTGVIIHSGKPGQFVAGADLDTVLLAERPEDATQQVRRLQRALNRLERLHAPSVAAIGGAALGGGFELALACDYRICVESESSILGLPEVQLGLLPAGGGCQRLPRLVGLSRAMELILQAKRLSPRRAKRYGAIDEVVHPAVLLEAARKRLRSGKRAGHTPWQPVDRLAEHSAAVRRVMYRQAEATVAKETRGLYPAPLRALEAIRCGQEQGAGAGMAAEAVAFGDLATGPVARELIGLFLATESLKREQRGQGSTRSINTVGVVGAGFMGAGIAQAAAVGDAVVRLRDIRPEAVAAGLKSVRDLTTSATRKGRFSRPRAAEIVSRVSGSTDFSGFSHADLVIEAVFEDVEVKRGVIAELEAVLAPEAVIASNTSALPIQRLAEGALHPERIVGMHFFSPVHRMPLLEVIRAPGSSDEAIGAAIAEGSAMGKTVIVVNDGPGFYTTRVLALMMQEAGRLFDEGASIESIDRAMTALGFPVGPLALTDEVGIDVAAHIAESLAQALPDRFAGSEAVGRLLADGRKGRKNGRGFYDYSRKKKRPDSSVYNLRQMAPASVPRTLIQRRLTLALLAEAIRCLQDGTLADPRDGDVGAILGFGYPPYLGGPFRAADNEGLPTVLDELRRMEYAYGAAFAAPRLLEERAAAGGTFHEARTAVRSAAVAQGG